MTIIKDNINEIIAAVAAPEALPEETLRAMLDSLAYLASKVGYDMLTVEETATELGVSPGRVRQLITRYHYTEGVGSKILGVWFVWSGHISILKSRRSKPGRPRSATIAIEKIDGEPVKE